MLRSYKESLDRFIDLSTNDATALFSKEHSLLGLTNIINCYKENGIGYDNVRLIALSDFTFTRNKLRWDSGFAYGCLILLEPNTDPIIPIEFRPNCCGVILSKIPNWENQPREFCDKLRRIINAYDKIDLDDFKRRNHFVAILRDQMGQNYALFHGSFGQVKRDTKEVPGLYIEMSPYWNNKISTSANKQFKYLIGKNALEYYSIYQMHEEFTLAYRKLIFDDLFDTNHEIVFNSTHEGLFDINTILLGGYVSETKFECPIMLAPEADLPIVSTRSSIKDLSNGHCDSKLFCSPHGGGYSWSYVKKAFYTQEENSSFAHLIMKNNDSVMYCDNIGDMPFQYRTNVANHWISEKGAGTIEKILQPIFFAKF